MKRIINVFNVSRHIAELRCGKLSANLGSLGPKILKLTILLEQWPCRMAWLLQIIENVEQMCSHHIRDSSLIQFLQGNFTQFDGNALDESTYWDILCTIPIQDLYQNGVRHLMSNEDWSNMPSNDSDPQLFEGLLLHSTPGGKSAEPDGPYAISVRDLMSIGREMRSQEYGECLRSYMFNMPMAIVDKVAKMMEKALVTKEHKTSTPPQISGTIFPSKHPSTKKQLVYEEITENIRRLMLERKECKKEGLSTDKVDAVIDQLQQDRCTAMLTHN